MYTILHLYNLTHFGPRYAPDLTLSVYECILQKIIYSLNRKYIYKRSDTIKHTHTQEWCSINPKAVYGQYNDIISRSSFTETVL